MIATVWLYTVVVQRITMQAMAYKYAGIDQYYISGVRIIATCMASYNNNNINYKYAYSINLWLLTNYKFNSIAILVNNVDL